MRYDLNNHSVKMGIRRQSLVYGLISLALGLVLFFMGGGQVWAFYVKYRSDAVEEYLRLYQAPTIALTTEANATLFGGIAVLLGLRFILDTCFLLRRKLIPANIPGPLDIQQAVGSITGKSLLGPVQDPKFGFAWLNSIRHLRKKPVSFLGMRSSAWDQTTTLGFVPYIITVYAASLAKRAIVWLILILALYGLTQVKYEQLFTGIPENVVTLLVSMRSLPVPSSVIGVLAMVGLLAGTVYFLIGGEPQRAEVELQTQEITCSKQPQMVFDLFEDVSRAIQQGNMPNRVTKLENNGMYSSGVGVSRDFCRQLFVEQQPGIIPSNTRIAGYSAAVLGAISVVWSLGYLTSPFGNADATVVSALYGIAGSLILLSAGLRIIRIGMVLCQYFRFESLAFFVDIRGQVSRSMVVVGAGRHDSVKSENETNRSEMLITYRTARLITESDSLLASRMLFAMHVDDELNSVTRELQTSLEKRTGTGVSIAGLNVTNQSVADVVNMNMAIHSMGETKRKSPVQTLLPSQLSSPSQDDQPNRNDEAEVVMNRAVRLRAKAMLALKKFHKDNDGSFDSFEDSAFDEAESLYLSGEKFFSDQRYAEATAAFGAVMELASVKS